MRKFPFWPDGPTVREYLPAAYRFGSSDADEDLRLEMRAVDVFNRLMSVHQQNYQDGLVTHVEWPGFIIQIRTEPI